MKNYLVLSLVSLVATILLTTSWGPALVGKITGTQYLPVVAEIHANNSRALSMSTMENRTPYTKYNDNKMCAVKSLPDSVINGIRKFVFFIGSDRSGSSIVGSLMDAHPHVVIANEWHFPHLDNAPPLDKPPLLGLKRDLFNTLYSRSICDVSEDRASSSKGYSLRVKGLWQGRYKDYIDVIGDKCSKNTTRSYLGSKGEFVENYKKLKKSFGIPIQAIHTVRNTFDVVATGAVIKHNDHATFRNLKHIFSSDSGKEAPTTLEKFSKSHSVDEEIEYVFDSIDATQKLTDGVFGRENVLDVHNCDLVDDPRGTMSRIFDFLEVDTTEYYLDVCAEKVFKSESRSRNMVVWTPEQIKTVEARMKKYDVLSRYSFKSDS